MKNFLLLLLVLSGFQIKAQCWKTIAAGGVHTVALRTDNTLWAWGNNTNGQLGDGTYTKKNIPTKIGTANDWKAIAAGYINTFAIKTDGSLWAWGDNYYGQLCDGSTIDKNTPIQIGTTKDWQTIAAGNNYILAIKTDGSLWAWGYNHYGQLGDGTTIDKNVPTQIGTTKDWQTISTGNYHSVALKTDGTLWAWGDNPSGQLGDNTHTNSSIPKKIGTATDWKTIAAGYNHTVAIKKDGTLWAWGEAAYGQLGNGTATDKYIPTQMGTSTDWKIVDAGSNFTIAIKTDGTLWAWGFNLYGELGIGTNVNSFIPIQIGIANNLQEVAVSNTHTVILNTNDDILTFGRNSDSQLGDGTTTDKNVPTLINCPGAFIVTTTQTNLICAGLTDGSASVASVSEGTAPYTYLWSNGATTNSIKGLTAGNYSCTVTDVTSLSITKSITITQPTSVTFTTTSTNACNGNNNGSITATATGGTAPYQYAISPDLVYQTSNVFAGLSSGTYTVSVKDSNGCIVTNNTVVITANNTPPPTATAQTFNTGATVADLQANGGNVISWYNDATGGQVLGLSTKLQTGTYYVSTTMNGCESLRTAVAVTVTSQIPTYVPTNGLIAYYPFNGNANDVSGNGYNGSVTAAILTTDKTGNPNSAYSFDGVSSYIDAAIATIPQNNSPRTISGWFKTNTPNSKENLQTCIFNYGSLSQVQRFSLCIYSKGYLETVNGPSFDNDDFYVNNFDYLSNDWYFFTITYDGTKVSLFVNGNFVAEKTVNLNTINNSFRIGKRISGDIINEYFKGSIDDIGIWDRVLTQEEMNLLYNSESNNNLYTLIPDLNFEKKLIALHIDSGVPDGKVHTVNVASLTSLGVSSSSITDLTGIQDFVALTQLYCSDNQLSTLDVSKNVALNSLSCYSNQLTSLDVSKNVALTGLSCYSNQLMSLDVSKNVTLTSLYCYSNQLTSLDVSKNVVLNYLECYSNKLENLNLKNGKNTLLIAPDSKTNPNLTCIQVDDVIYSNTKWTTFKDATASYSGNCLSPYVVISSTFEDKLIALGIDKDGKNGSVLLADITNVKSIDVSNSGITELSGIEYFTDLETLICKGNSISTIDLSKNTALKYLDCSNNPLTTLDVSKNKLLTELYCDGVVTIIKKSSNTKNSNAATQLIVLDLSNNLFLTKLSCSNNQLVSLDVSKNTLLTVINCPNNSLQNLNLSNGNNTKMLNVNFKSNSSLSCIKVDDEIYSNANWAGAKDQVAIYSKTACTLGIEDVVFDKIAVYPNPVKGQLHIDNIVLEKVTVYDALGKLIKTTKFTNGSDSNIIDLAGLAKGIYYVYLESEGANTAKKIVAE